MSLQPKRIPFFSLDASHQDMHNDLDRAFSTVLDSNWFILGQEVERFECAYAAGNQTKFCIGVANGLAALHPSLRAIDVSAGDEVIVPSNTHIATVLAVLLVGATPVFVEPRTDTYNLDSDLVAQAVSPRTRAIIPVHLFGQACEMDSIISIAQQHGLSVIVKEGLSAITLHNLLGEDGTVEYMSERHELGLFSLQNFQDAFQGAGLTLQYLPDFQGLAERGLYIGRPTIV
jgi:dTDP-4-amino-4,6-dideoxygalactose transaminase